MRIATILYTIKVQKQYNTLSPAYCIIRTLSFTMAWTFKNSATMISGPQSKLSIFFSEISMRKIELHSFFMGEIRVKKLCMSTFQVFWDKKVLRTTIKNVFLILISCSLKKGASDNTISYFDQSFRFSEIQEDLVKISRGGQRTEREQINIFSKFSTVTRIITGFSLTFICCRGSRYAYLR